MDNRILDILRQMRDSYGEEVFYHSRRAKNMMNDLCSHMPRERIQAKNFIEMNGYFVLKHAGGAYPIIRDKLVDTYKSTYHVDEQAAEWIVDVFSALLGYITLDCEKRNLLPSQKTDKEVHSANDLHIKALDILSGYRKQSTGYDARVINQPEKAEHSIDKASVSSVDGSFASLVKERISLPKVKSNDKPQSIIHHNQIRNEPKPVIFTELTQQDPPDSTEIQYIHRHIAADYHTVAIKQDGTVTATGYNNAGQCNVWNWFDVKSVATGSGFTVALRENGTVVATGRNEFGQCNVGRWNDIAAISAGARHTIGLRADGTVVATGENKYGECNVSSWRNITAIFGGNQCTYGIKRDKKVLARGYNKNMDYDTGVLTDVVRIADANPYGALALCSDGTVVKARQLMKGDFSKIQGLVELVATPDCFIGLRKNGTVRVLAYYWEPSGVECSTDSWRNVCEIAVGRYHVVGLRHDGTLVAAMLHTNKSLNKGQCDVRLWSGIRVR